MRRARFGRWAALPVLVAVVAFLAAGRAVAEAEDPDAFHFGITPVFLVDQARFLDGWGAYLSERLGRPVRFVRRKTYAEITDLLLSGELEAARICSFSYVFNRHSLPLIGVPVFRGEPYYQSYLIVPAQDRETRGYEDLAGKVFAYVEPRSNTGYLYPRYAIQQLGRDANHYFRETFYTWSHPESVSAVAERVADAAAVDSYIWESLMLSEPALAERTRVVSGSVGFGFPPIVGGSFLAEAERLRLSDILLTMHQDPEGRRLLSVLHLDRFIEPRAGLYDSIPEMIQAVLPMSE